VQGVGFRPFVARLADKYRINGFVQNSAFGAFIVASGDEASLDGFCIELRSSHPPLAKIDKITITKTDTTVSDGFYVEQSSSDGTKISFFPPDLSICPECERELFDKNDRRYGYPLINCQNCGPRFTLIKALPYDRAKTTMDVFEMCDACKNEYENKADRRFHAEPVSCEVCGPSFYFTDAKGEVLGSSKNADMLSMVGDALESGSIVAMKGVGGFHLLCRADSNEAVVRLRSKKRRAKKPLAVMFKNIDELSAQCEMSQKEIDTVCSYERPITIVKKSKNYSLSPFISHESAFLGVFLPYSGTYSWLTNLVSFPIVATSANISDEPIITNEKELFERLNGTFDFACYYDRHIVVGCDDSVVRVSGDDVIKIRNSRGYAPVFKMLDGKYENTFCAGAHQKNCFSFVFENILLTSGHIGELGSLDSAESYGKSVKHFADMYDVRFSLAVCDKNRRYASSEYVRSLGIKTLELQHHKAHFLSLLFEKDMLGDNALGVVWDGTGLGDDGKMWGGEFFVKQNYEITRVASLPYFWIIGGEKAAKEPYKCAISLLLSFGKQKEAEEFAQKIGIAKDESKLLFDAFDKKLNCYETSSMGRLFDGVAALLGVVGKESYDGESGLMLESLYDGGDEFFECKALDVRALLELILSEGSSAKTATKFINTLSRWIVAISVKYDLPPCCSGGVFQNAALVSSLKKECSKQNITPIFHSKFSPNDSAISIGQAAFAKLYFEDKIKENI
jgi:hydrogenase maturation protein HypF